MRIQIKMIMPKKLFKDVNVISAVAKAQREYTEPDLMKMFHETVEGWEHRPNFDSKQVVNTKRISMSVGLFGANNKSQNIYKLVNAGSPRHPISGKRGFLRFQSGYRSATIPGQLFSHRASRFGDWWGAAKVDHPGFAARNFDMEIAGQYKSTFYKDMQAAIDEATKGYQD
jgi:hypothetical protein